MNRIVFTHPFNASQTIVDLDAVTSCTIVIADPGKPEAGIDFVVTLAAPGVRDVLSISTAEKDELVRLLTADSLNLNSLGIAKAAAKAAAEAAAS